MMTRDEMLSLRLTALIILSAAGNGDEDPTTPRDGAPPGRCDCPRRRDGPVGRIRRWRRGNADLDGPRGLRQHRYG